MVITDINGTERKVKQIERITHSRQNDAIAFKHVVKDGDLHLLGEQEMVDVEEEFIKVTIVGKTGREWEEFYPAQAFEERNPNVRI